MLKCNIYLLSLGINNLNTITMNEHLFLQYATRLKRNTGNEIDVIGMAYTSKKFVIDIYGNSEDNYKMIIDQVARKVRNKWIDLELSKEHTAVLEIIFNAEVNKALEDNKLSVEIENEQEQYEIDIETYGRTELIYPWGLGW